jgi:hypothetical protein
MEPGTPVIIPYPLSSSFPHILPSLRGGERGVYLRAQDNGIGQTVHHIEINGRCYVLREGEFLLSQQPTHWTPLPEKPTT